MTVWDGEAVAAGVETGSRPVFGVGDGAGITDAGLDAGAMVGETSSPDELQAAITETVISSATAASARRRAQGESRLRAAREFEVGGNWMGSEAVRLVAANQCTDGAGAPPH